MFLKIENITIRLGKFNLKDIHLEVKEGQYVTIIGPSGSGKSILLENIAGFYTPNKGKVYLKGEDITYKNIEDINISIVYQDYVLFPHMSVYENILYGLKKKSTQKADHDKEVREIAALLNIDHLLERKPLTLSGGEMQRTSIARALVVKPELLLMDEAFSALDYKIKKEMRKLVKDVAKKYGTTVLHVTHDFEDVWAMADMCVVLRFGEILQVGKPDEIFAHPNSDFVANFVGTNIFEATVVRKEPDLTILKADGFEVYSSCEAKIGEKVRLSIRPENIIITTTKIETSAKNEIEGMIIKVEKRGHIMELSVQVNSIILIVMMTPNSYEHLSLALHSHVFLSFKATSVGLY
ncbi:MAG: ATP-binding cassette domain-containing protein [Campylobacterales bacterium]|nr:ATP-binding cassette domain-containing protein [Campylobacterales bacterium]MBN2832449.1 ATP-binding cassette domain-containing protein [Campylobacterales bacterium]